MHAHNRAYVCLRCIFQHHPRQGNGWIWVEGGGHRRGVFGWWSGWWLSRQSCASYISCCLPISHYQHPNIAAVSLHFKKRRCMKVRWAASHRLGGVCASDSVLTIPAVAATADARSGWGTGWWCTFHLRTAKDKSCSFLRYVPLCTSVQQAASLCLCIHSALLRWLAHHLPCHIDV